MKAPLPEVPPFTAKKRDFAKSAPVSLSALCGVKALIALLYPILDADMPDWTPFWNWTFNGIIAALSCLLIYYLWRGFGLARGLWLWISLLILPLYFYTDESIHHSRGDVVLTWFDFGVTLFSMFYLNLPAIKAHFARRKAVELS